MGACEETEVLNDEKLYDIENEKTVEIPNVEDKDDHPVAPSKSLVWKSEPQKSKAFHEVSC